MSIGSIIEVVVSVAMIVAGIVAYRRAGSQTAMILFVFAILILIHGLSLMEYHPLPSELPR